MTEEELIEAGYTKVDSLTRFSAWVSGETGAYHIHDMSNGELREIGTADMTIRLVLLALEGSGDVLDEEG